MTQRTPPVIVRALHDPGAHGVRVDEKGDLVPGGLAGDDGYCFNLDEWDEEEVVYLENRLGEACLNASK